MLRTEVKVGLFLIISGLLIVGSIAYVAYEKGFFAKTHIFTLASKSGEYLTEGMPVIFSGFKIGTVQALELSERGYVLIKINIPENHVKWIRSDSTFIVNKPLLGTPRIVVVTENLESPILSPKQIQQVVNVDDINETIKKAQPLLDRISRIADNIEVMTARVADPQGSVNKILVNSEKVAANLAQKKSFLEMAIEDRATIDSIQAGLRQTKDITAEVIAILKKVDGMADKEVPGILNKVEAIADKEVPAILKKVEAMADKTDALVYGREGILSNVNAALKDVVSKLSRLNITIDNINKISTEAADSAVDLKALRAQIDETVISLSDLAKELEKKIPFQKTPEIKLP